MTRAAQAGDTVRVHYTGTLADGSVFDSSEGREPLEFTLGGGQVIEGFDSAVTGMRVGEEKQVTIAVDDAYGPRRDELMLLVDHSAFPTQMQPQLGQQLQVSPDDEQVMIVTVADISDEGVLLDGNHPLAGEDLTFALRLVEIA